MSSISAYNGFQLGKDAWVMLGELLGLSIIIGLLNQTFIGKISLFIWIRLIELCGRFLLVLINIIFNLNMLWKLAFLNSLRFKCSYLMLLLHYWFSFIYTRMLLRDWILIKFCLLHNLNRMIRQLSFRNLRLLLNLNRFNIFWFLSIEINLFFCLVIVRLSIFLIINLQSNLRGIFFFSQLCFSIEGFYVLIYSWVLTIIRIIFLGSLNHFLLLGWWLLILLFLGVLCFTFFGRERRFFKRLLSNFFLWLTWRQLF